jgi:hypothetical protein
MNHLTEEKDERRGKPSASNGEAYEACPGRHAMSAGLKDTRSEAADEGVRIHSWLEESAGIDLAPEELELAMTMREQRDMIIDLTFPKVRDKGLLVKEKRLWYRGKRFSGKADLIVISGGVALVIDYKCGRIPVTPAETNGQMRWNVALMANHYAFDEVTVALIQPRCGPPSTYTYDKKAIKKARAKVTATLRKMESNNPVIRAGEKQCKYCKAKALCPALQKKQDALMRISDVHALTPVQLSEVLAVLPAVKAQCKAIEVHAKELLHENVNAIPGYGLTDPTVMRSVNDIVSAFKRLEGADLIDEEKFMECCSVKIGDLQKAIAAHTSSGPSEARRIMNTALGNAITEKMKAVSLRRAQ